MPRRKSTICLREYLGKRKVFVIPKYQRGYVWGKSRPNEDDSVTYLIHDLKEGFISRPPREIFLQGVTVTESSDTISVIDGQQRTTFFYLLLKHLGYNGEFKLRYLSGREQAQRYINNVTEVTCDPVDEAEPFQDIYFFKKSISIFRKELEGLSKREFAEYLLDNVRFLYINIPKAQAIRVFSMMNGSKAIMRPEEVIKADLLRLATRSETCHDLDDDTIEWQANMLRSRYAREWDKWLYWWNRKDVQTMFECNNPMGLLISSAVGANEKDVLTFDLFKRKMLDGKSEKEAKRAFDRLRRLQKLFEDLFNDYRTHNKLGAIIAVLHKSEEIRSFVRDVIASPADYRDKLDDYYRCVFLGMTHREMAHLLNIGEVSSKDRVDACEAFSRSYDETLRGLRDPMLYKTLPEFAFRYLLRRNINMDIEQSRKFDFGIWRANVRSLEHIFAKSKVWHWEGDSHTVKLDGNDVPVAREIVEGKDSGYLDRASLTLKQSGKEADKVFTTTEHGIGNLVLLYKDENSSFNNSPFDAKKELFFNPNKKELTKSRRLLHTVCVFAERKEWDAKAIVKNALDVIAEFEEYYSNLKRAFYV